MCEESVGRWVGSCVRRVWVGVCVHEESVGRWVGSCVRRVWVGGWGHKYLQ